MTIREKLKTVKTNKKYRTFILIKNQNNEKLELVPLTFQSMIKDKLMKKKNRTKLWKDFQTLVVSTKN